MIPSHDEERNRPAPPDGVDVICDAFEADWLAATRHPDNPDAGRPQPRIEDFLPRGKSIDQDELLRELLLAEWDLRRRHGDEPEPDAYHARFPQSRRVITDLWEVWKARGMHSVSSAALEIATTKDRLMLEGAGTVIDRYKLLEKLGEGGFGVVWAAEQRTPVKRRVALKIIKLGMDTKQVVARFEAERQALALMDHPNIAKVLDAGSTEAGRPYFVMELVRGIPITKYCDQERLSTPSRLDLFMKVCHAIQHAHQKGIIHRDIKPNNILVTLHDGVPVPKVIDFGIAKATQQELTEKTIYTHFAQFIGTPAYMSPEQAEMSGLDIDTRSDIYSLGVLLYELLTGATPFDAKELMRSGLDEMRKIIREREPPTPSSRLTKLLKAEDCNSEHSTVRIPHSAFDKDLDWIVMKCLEKDRARRYETANNLAQDLKRHLQNEPVVARPPSTAYRLQKALRRNKLAFSAAAMVVLALILGLGLATIGWRQARLDRDRAVQARNKAARAETAEAQQRKRAVQSQQREAELRVQAEFQELAARRRAYAADMNLLEQALAANNLRRARQLLERHRPQEGEEDLRGWEWRYHWQRCRGDFSFTLYHKLKPYAQTIFFAAFLNNGHVATFDGEGVVGIWNPADRTEVARLQEKVVTSANWGQACMSQDGKWLAAVGEDVTSKRVQIWDMESGQALPPVPIGGGFISSIALSPDNQWLAVFDSDEGVSIWDVATRQKERTFRIASVVPQWRGAVRFSPDGTLLAIGDVDGHVRLLDVATWTETQEYRASTVGDGVLSLAFSPDGRILVSGFGWADRNIAVWDIAARERLATLDGHRGHVSSLAFSPDGASLASASGDQTIKLWNTAIWKEEATLTGHEDEVWTVNFSRDGQRLVSGGKDASVYVWPTRDSPFAKGRLTIPYVGTGRPGEAPAEGEEVFQAISRSRQFHDKFDFSPSTSEVAAIDAAGGLSITDLRTMRTTPAHPDLGTKNSAVFWSPTGELLLGAQEPPRIKIWDRVRDDVSVYTFRVGGPPSFHYLPQRQVMLILHQGAAETWVVRQWDVPSRSEHSSFTIPEVPHDENLVRFAVSPDERFLAMAARDRLVVRSLATGGEASSVAPDLAGINGIGVSPGGTLLAIATTDAPDVEIWNLQRSERMTSLRSHASVPVCVAFSPDGRRLCSSTIGHESIRLWDTTSWEETANLNIDGGAVVPAVRFLPDGNTLVAIDRSQRIHMWRAPSWEEIDAAEAPGEPLP